MKRRYRCDECERKCRYKANAIPQDEIYGGSINKIISECCKYSKWTVVKNDNNTPGQ